MAESHQEMRTRLVEEMIRTNNEARGLLDKALAENRGFSAEEQQEYDRRNTAINEMETRVKAIDDGNRSFAAVDRYKEGAERLLRPGGDRQDAEMETLDQRALAFFQGRSEEKFLEVPFVDLQVTGGGMRGMKMVHETRADLGLRAIESRSQGNSLERRTGLNTITAAAGDATVPIGFRAVLYQHLIFNSAIRQTRATVLTTDSGEPIQLPKTTAHPALGTIVSEAALINENDPTFGQGTLHAYKFGNLIQISTELEQDTAVDLLGYIARITGVQLANGAGSLMIVGTGTNQPQGVLVGVGAATGSVVAGTSTPAANGPVYKELESIYDAIIPPYQINGEWLMNQTTVSKLRQLTDLYGRPLWVPSLTSDMPSQLFGKPVYLDPYVPSAGSNSTSIAFGDFAPYFIRDVQGIRFERSVEYAFGNDLVTYRALLRTDGQLLDLTGAIATYKGGTA